MVYILYRSKIGFEVLPTYSFLTDNIIAHFFDDFNHKIRIKSEKIRLFFKERR